MRDLQAVLTPQDAPGYFDADWRAQLVEVALEKPLDKQALCRRSGHDRMLLDHLEVVGRMRAGRGVPKHWAAHAMAIRWHDDPRLVKVRNLVEALLLTDAPLDKLALDLGVAEEVVRLYAALFLDVRDGAGKLNVSPVRLAQLAQAPAGAGDAATRERYALRGLATRGGYRMVLTTIGYDGHWAEAPEVEPGAVVEELLGNGRLALLASGELGLDELEKVRRGWHRDKQVRFATREADKDNAELLKTCQHLLQLAAPTMERAMEMTPERLAATNDALKRKLECEGNIGQTPITDHGPLAGQKKISDQLDEQLAGDKKDLL